MELSSVYVCVEDMARALDFYRALFEAEPAQEVDRFSTFEFDAANFGLYNPEYDDFGFESGTNCIPNFEVDDVDAACHRIETIAPEMVHDEILEFGTYRTFRLLDTEGNEIEVFGIDSE
ncbi:VOC family protein [Haladaptatus salinisoli]|uniref:VOC family protein n=1 Tax=Haladaptatus salinisoli TaxID=2884876 RepID=UPI001D0B1CBE|nr:VOC family protein [Haladaptatus salinisoli]